MMMVRFYVLMRIHFNINVVYNMVGINRLMIVVLSFGSWVNRPMWMMLHNCVVCLLQIMVSWHYMSMRM